MHYIVFQTISEWETKVADSLKYDVKSRDRDASNTRIAPTVRN